MFSSGSGSSTTAAFDGVLKQFEEDDAFARGMKMINYIH
jgi:hypothetical protein